MSEQTMQQRLDALVTAGVPDLRAWLAELKPRSHIGRCGRGAECLIAVWVEARLQLPPGLGRVYACGFDVRVFGPPGHPADGHGERVALVKLPEALRPIVVAFDELGDGRGGRDYSVTVAEARALFVDDAVFGATP